MKYQLVYSVKTEKTRRVKNTIETQIKCYTHRNIT